MKEEKTGPPKWPNRILRWFCAEEHLEILLGDLEELFEYRVETEGLAKARFHYIKDAFDMLRPFARKKKRSKLKNNLSAMYKNYFKISFRNMRKHKVYSGINIAGLSVGIACFMLIFLYVQDELSYDRYHEYSKDIYRVVVEDYNEGGEVSRIFTYTSPMHAPVLRDEYAQVVAAVRFNPWNFPVIKYKEKQFNETYFNFVEPSIFDIFSFDFLEGTSDNALDAPYSVVITKTTAEKYFGEEPALGKTIQVIDRGEGRDFQVTGVIEDFPEQSHISYNFLASWSTYENRERESALDDYYGNYNYATYVRLQSGARVKDLKAQMPAMLDKYIDKINGRVPSEKIGLRFQKLTDIHLDETAGAGGTSNAYYIYLFSAIGVMVLLIACINYMNLATAKYSNRLKEIGVRKVMGAAKSNISQQFLSESIFYALISLLLGFGMALLSLPKVNGFANKNLTLNPIENGSIIVFVIGLMIFIGFLAGSYPAMFMSRFSVVDALKSGKVKTSNRSIFRTSLVIFQFTITIGLIIGVTVVDQQIKFIKNQDLGFGREMVVNFWASPPINQSLEVFKSELKSNPNIIGASASSRIPTGRLGDALGAKVFKAGAEELVDFRLPFVRIDNEFLDVYDIEIVAGAGLTEEVLPDSVQKFVFNEKAVQMLGWSNPEESIGQKIEYGGMTGFVVGVVKDFNFESIHSAIQPMILVSDGRNKRQMSVKISPSNISETLDFIEDKWLLFNPERDFNSSFVDELFDRQYDGEQQLGQISKVFSIIAILIACLGLLGLVSFTMEQRAKEISVRKVLGASVQSILLMVNKGYALIILIAFTIAVPVAYYFLGNWLDTFAYHISIGVGIIAFSGLMALGIAVITICTQAIRTALGNPVDSLRSE